MCIKVNSIYVKIVCSELNSLSALIFNFFGMVYPHDACFCIFKIRKMASSSAVLLACLAKRYYLERQIALSFESRRVAVVSPVVESKS